MTDLLNAVAPPIAEHEVIQVWLSHDMVGYEGVESLVYRALAKVCPFSGARQPYTFAELVACLGRSWSKSTGVR
jgi:hypothetical protein